MEMYFLKITAHSDHLLDEKDSPIVIVPKRRFEKQEWITNYLHSLLKITGLVYPIFLKYCIPNPYTVKVSNTLSWFFYHIPLHIKRCLSQEELKILYWFCLYEYESVTQETPYHAEVEVSVNV